MKPDVPQKTRTTQIILSHRDEEILRSIYQYRFMTAEDVAYLLFSPSSVAYVRRLLTALAGGADLQPNTFLCRFPMPSTTSGGRERIFALGVKGRNFLSRDAGLPVDWYFRLGKYRDLGFSHLRHALLLTRFVVAAHYWSRKQSIYTLTQTRLSHELAQTSAKVIPDAWLLFENQKGKKYPILLEIDRGMEFQVKFKRHVKARVEFIQRGDYTNIFGVKAVIVAYATTGQTPAYRETRRTTMMTWTQEVLAELGGESWAGIFRFTSLLLSEMYTQGIFEKRMWYTLDSPDPVPLLQTRA